MNKSGDKETEKGKKYCLRLLSLRPRTEKEIETRLENKCYSEEARKRVMDFLKGNGLIDDAKFAGDWIDSRLRSNPRGRAALESELVKKGISQKIIEKAFSDKAVTLDEKRIAGALIRKRIGKTGSGTDRKLKGKLFQFLLRKGFDAEVAEEVVNEELENKAQ